MIGLFSVLGLFDLGKLLPWLFGPSSLQQDINLLVLGFKIVILLFIISFARSRFGAGPIVTILVFVLAYIMLFTNYFYIFGPMMFVYFFIIFGFISIVFDLSIAKPWRKMPGVGADTSAKEQAEKREAWMGRM